MFGFTRKKGCVCKDENDKVKIAHLLCDIEDLKFTHKLALREMEQLCKIKCEKIVIELKKKDLAMEKEYSGKVIASLICIDQERSKMVDKLLSRIPNISASLEVKKGK